MRQRSSYNPLLKSYPDSEKVNRCSIGAEMLYVRLIAASDDGARYWGEPGIVLARLLTLRMVDGTATLAMVTKWIQELVTFNLVTLYESEGRRFLLMVDVFKTLRKDVPPSYSFPDPSKCKPIQSGPDAARNVTGDECIESDDVPADPDQTQTQTRPDPFSSSASPKDSGLVKAATAWLETIYLAYPRKVEKQAAVKAIAAAVKRIKDQDDAVGFLLDRVTAYAKAVKGQDPQYIPYPSTWFNSGRYEDDETQWQRTGNHRAGTPQIGRIDAAPDKYAGVGVTINVDPPAQHTFSGGLETDAW